MNAPLGLLVPVLVGLTAGCGQPPVVMPPPASAEQAFVELEQRLLTAQGLRIGYRIEAEGAFTASLSGELVFSGDTGVDLAGTGTFGGAPVALQLVADEARMRGGSAQQQFDDPAPDHLRQALVLGLTRMGLLHNLARLSAGRSPDHADGGVAEWVQPRAIEWLSHAMDDEPAQPRLRFAIEVAGQDAGDAELWLDALDNPVRRRQTVRFPGGEMRVLEEYEVLRPPAAPEGQREVREAATRVLATLDAERRASIMFAFDDAERFNFHYVPRQRAGLGVKDMTLPQRTATHRLLQTALSARGYTKVSGIIELEALLYQLSNRNPMRDPERYFLTFFGEPSGHAPWGWRFEGHHLSLNFSSVEGELFSTTPAFMGANPAEVRSGPSAGKRVLAAEEDLGRALVQALDPPRRERAIISARAPSDIITGVDRQARLGRFEGLPASAMTEEQVATLWRIVEEYARNLRADMAEAQLAKIRDAGIEHLHFAWAGSIEPGRPHYYRIHGPTVLFEYDNVQNNANHIHTVWRDLDNDFGDDVLRRHYETAPQGHGHQ